MPLPPLEVRYLRMGRLLNCLGHIVVSSRYILAAGNLQSSFLIPNRYYLHYMCLKYDPCPVTF